MEVAICVAVAVAGMVLCGAGWSGSGVEWWIGCALIGGLAGYAAR